MKLYKHNKLLVLVLIIVLANFAVFAASGFQGQTQPANAAVPQDDAKLLLPIVFKQWTYEPPNCYRLSLTHTGQGTDPVASPVKSSDCQEDHTYRHGDVIELSGASPNSGWHIAGWTGTVDDASKAVANMVAMPSADHTASVNYSKTITCYSLTTTHTGQGADPIASPAQSAGCSAGKYQAGEKIQLSGVTPDPGWHITGWTGTANNASTTATNSVTMPTSDHISGVNYARSCYLLTLTHSGQGSDPVASPDMSAACTEKGYYVGGEKIQLSGAVPDTDYRITSWSGTDDDTSTAATNSLTMPESSHTASVIYDVKGCYRLTLSHTGNGSDPVASPLKSAVCTQNLSYTEGDTINLSGAVPDDGWVILSWTGTTNNNSTSATNTVTMPATDHSAAINYKGTCFALTVGHTGQGNNPNASPSNSAGCNNGQYTAGETINFSNANPSTGWHIAGWTGTVNNSSTSSTNTATMPANNHSVTVVYEMTCYQLTLSHTGQGSNPVASPSNSSGCNNGYYVFGETVNLSGAVPATGWRIVGWTGTNNNGSTANINVVTMPANAHTSSVNYDPLPCYQLTLGHTGQGTTPTASPPNSTNCNNGYYVAGASINLIGATPASGWNITGWSGTNNNGSTASTNTVTMPNSAHTAAVNYDAPCYTLTLGHTGQGTDPVASSSTNNCSSGEYKPGENINLSGAVPAVGWAVTSWSGTNNNSSTSSTNSVTMPASNHIANVNYTQPCFTLTIGHTGQGNNPAASPTNSAGCTSGKYHAGATITLSGATPAADWQIASWSGTNNNASTASNNAVTMPPNNHTATVNYEEICYTLTLTHTGQGNNPTPAPDKSTGCDQTDTYHAGQSIALTAGPATGWGVTSWSGTTNNNSQSTTNNVTMPSGNHTASVNYGLACYQLTLSHTGSGSNPSASPANSTGCSTGYYHYQETINLSGAVPASGWEISSWSGTNNNGSTASSNTVTMPASARTATVNYTLICYTLTRSHTGQGSDPVATPANSTGCTSGKYHAGAAINLTTAPATGWKVKDWAGTNNNSSTSNSNTATMPASNHTVTVNYERVCYQLTLTHSGSGSDPQIISPSNSDGCSAGYFHYQETVNVGNAAPSSGWVILNWNGTDNNSSTASSNTVTMPASVRTATVNYGPPPCNSLTLQTDGQGSVSASPTNSSGCSAGNYHPGESISLNISPAAGWLLDGCEGTTTDPSCGSVTMPNSAHTVTVYFKEICYALSLSHSGNGQDPTANPTSSAGCDADTYHSGESITLTANPNAGYHVKNWSGTNNNGSILTENTVTMPSSTHAASVTYEENTSPFSCVSPTSNNATYAYSSSSTVTGFTPGPGDIFAAFKTGYALCTGEIGWDGSPTAIAVWGNDPAPINNPGMVPGETILWRVWDYSTNKVCTATVTFVPPVTGVYTPGAFGVIDNIDVTCPSSLVQPAETQLKTPVAPFISRRSELLRLIWDW